MNENIFGIVGTYMMCITSNMVNTLKKIFEKYEDLSESTIFIVFLNI